MIAWDDEAIVIASKKYGERQLIATLLSKEHGRYKGVFRPTKASKSLVERGSVVQCQWSARLSEHLGSWKLEPLYSSLAFVLQKPLALNLLNSACSLVDLCLPERDSAPKMYTSLLHLLHLFEDSKDPFVWLKSYCYFELFLLEQTGITLDFKACAATGSQEDLIYVSPRTGRAVSREAGEPYREKLLPLPRFLQPIDKEEKIIDFQEILAALTLSGYFLNKYVFIPHEIDPPAARHRLLMACQNLGQVA